MTCNKDLRQGDDVNGLAFNIYKLKLIFWKQMERERFFREYPVLVVASKKFKIISESYSLSLYALKFHTPGKHTHAH